MRMTKRPNSCFVFFSFRGLVVLGRSLDPIPSRTRPLNSSAPMVLWLKPWESRSLTGLPRTKQFLFTCHDRTKCRFPFREAAFFADARPPHDFSAMIERHHRESSLAVHLQNRTRFKPRNQKTPHSPRRLPCVRSFAPSPL